MDVFLALYITVVTVGPEIIRTSFLNSCYPLIQVIRKGTSTKNVVRLLKNIQGVHELFGLLL